MRGDETTPQRCDMRCGFVLGNELLCEMIELSLNAFKRSFGNCYFTAVMLILFLLSCQKNPCKHPPIRYLSPEIKDHGLFKPGTYWVYQNDSTMQLDSITIVSIDTGTKAEWSEAEECGGMYIIFYGEYASSNTSNNSMGTSFYYHISETMPGAVFFYENDTANIFASDFVVIYIESFLQSYINDSLYEVISEMTLNGNYFENVYERKYFNSPIENGLRTNYYSASNYGLIKKEVFDSISANVESWSLLRYHIIQ